MIPLFLACALALHPVSFHFGSERGSFVVFPEWERLKAGLEKASPDKTFSLSGKPHEATGMTWRGLVIYAVRKSRGSS